MVRFQGVRLLPEACTRLQWNINIEPGWPLGATIPPRSTSRVMVSLSTVHSG